MKNIIYTMILFNIFILIGCDKEEKIKEDAIPTLNVKEKFYTIEDHAQNLSIEIKSNIAWTIFNEANWITLDKTSGYGNDILNVKIAANKNKDNRSATLILKSQEINDINLKITQYAPLATKITVESGICTIEKKNYSATGYYNAKDGKTYHYKYILNLKLGIYGNQLASDVGWEINTNKGISTVTIKELSSIKYGKVEYGINQLEWYMNSSSGSFIYKGFATRKSNGSKVYGEKKTITLAY